MTLADVTETRVLRLIDAGHRTPLDLAGELHVLPSSPRLAEVIANLKTSGTVVEIHDHLHRHTLTENMED